MSDPISDQDKAFLSRMAERIKDNGPNGLVLSDSTIALVKRAVGQNETALDAHIIRSAFKEDFR